MQNSLSGFLDWTTVMPLLVSIAGAFLVGWLILRRFMKLAEEKHRQALEMARLEAQVAAREIRSRADLEIERKKNEVEAEFNKRELQISLLEQQSKAQLQTLEKDKLAFDERSKALHEQEEKLSKQLSQISSEKISLESERQLYHDRIQEISGLTREQAQDALKKEVERKCADELRQLKQEILTTGEANVRDEARRILIDSMQRLATTPMHDITATIVPIPNDAMKGRLIGREGRNIKSFESATGVTLLIDETPDSVLVSSFDPVRREVARIALIQLVKDGRIHPASIEEAVIHASEQVKQSVIEFGEEALRKTRINNVHPEIVSLLGKLKFRLSNNQNSLDHSIEVANLCALIAAELKLDTEIARRAGLFHDIGKSIEGEYEGSHAIAAANLLKRHGEVWQVVNAVAAHHAEVPAESPYAGILVICDGISAVRPGARSESVDSYLQRVSSLESLAKSFPGVTECYAMQAGREIRVIVCPDKCSDEVASQLARDLRTRIEEEMQYPGSIKITVVRERRFSETAK